MDFIVGKLLAFLRTIARVALGTARHAAGLWSLFSQIVVATVRGKVAWRDIFTEMHETGVRSAPLVFLTAVLSGIVMSMQGGYQFTGNIPLYILGSVVANSVVLELGPVMTAFVVIGRVGARNTAQIGTMQVSEQIDALYSLGRDPVAALAAPRLIAGIICMPLLVGFANGVGLFAGQVSAQATVGLGSEAFFFGARLFWHNWDFFYSLLKAFAFGFIIPMISCHMGLLTRGGAEGVGRNTTTSVVFMILATLLVDATFPPLFLN
jgi:phospholipid/cholesterol/gamma-HCH transport system permease protein